MATSSSFSTKTKFSDTSWTPSKLSQEGYLSLAKITNGFSAPITEEHAWAVVFECLKCLKSVMESKPSRVFIVTSTRHILLHREGRVHESTFLSDQNEDHDGSTTEAGSTTTSIRETASSEQKVVRELALVMYEALDTGLKEDEERSLSPGLENLLGHMIAAGENCRKISKETDKVDTDDEGIEQDHFDEDRSPVASLASSSEDEELPPESNQRRSKKDCIRSILGLCESHLSVESEAETHYRNVCRALLSEALELSSFLEKTSTHESEHSEELKQLALKDWANLWIQTMSELRHGVKLKKVNFTKTPIEYALTPYEILMDDIRSRRYNLKKVMVDGELPPKVKKDAHDIILDFIRSRPPLRPVSQRVLPPPRKYSTPQELLMESIRSDSARNNLRKTSGPPEIPLIIDDDWSGCTKDVCNNVEPKIIPVKSYNNTSDLRSRSRSIQVQSSRSQHHQGRLSHSKSTMQRSQSLSSCTRIVIRPDPKFSKFNPEDEEEEDMEDSDEDIIESNAGTGGSNAQPLAVASEFNSRSVPTQPRFTAPPPASSSSYNSRITVKRRLGRAGSVGLGPSHLGSLSNLTSVAEQPPTPCAVSHPQQQPLWPPKVLLSTPCIGIIREAEQQQQKFREMARNSSGGEEINNTTSMTTSTNNFKRETLWMRRHSLHSQPQPLSVHGFGYGGVSHQAGGGDRHNGLNGYHQADRLSELRQQQQPTANRSFRRLSMTSLHLAHSASDKFLKRRSFDGSGYHAGQPINQPPSVMVTNPGMPVNSVRRMSSSSEDSRSANRRLSSPPYVQMDSNQVYVRPSSMTSMHANPGNTNHLRVGRAEKSTPTLTLSHEELIHIRSALSRNKLESLCDPDLKAQIEKGNICFHCTKTKFNMFFNRKQQCELCQRNVCSRCISKAKLPDNNHVPVLALSPVTNGGSKNHHREYQPVPKQSFIDQNPSNSRVRRSNTLGRYDRPKSMHGGDTTSTSTSSSSNSTNGIFSSLSSTSSSSSSPILNVCLDCKQSVEIMTRSPTAIENVSSSGQVTAPFQQRRRQTLQNYQRDQFHHRRSFVTKSLIFD